MCAGGRVQNILCLHARRRPDARDQPFDIDTLSPYRFIGRTCLPGRGSRSSFSLGRNEKRAFYKYCHERDTLKSARLQACARVKWDSLDWAKWRSDPHVKKTRERERKKKPVISRVCVTRFVTGKPRLRRKTRDIIIA